MTQSSVRISVPAQADFARSVRMLAANLAVVSNMSVDDVEDVRMAAEEGFVFSCATNPGNCEIVFDLTEGAISMTFSLGADDSEEDELESLELAELLLSAVCDEYEVAEDGSALHVTKRTSAHAE